jgi:hypothetical protein
MRKGCLSLSEDGGTRNCTASLLCSHSFDGQGTGRFSDTFVPELMTCSGVLSILTSLLHGITFPGSHYFQTLGVLHASKNVTEGFTKLSYVCVVRSHDMPSQHKCSLCI